MITFAEAITEILNTPAPSTEDLKELVNRSPWIDDEEKNARLAILSGN